MNKKLIIIINIIIICLIVIFLLFKYNNLKNENTTNDTNDNITSNYTFKKFIFSVPNSFKYSLVNDDVFKLEEENNYAEIEILYDTNDLLKKTPEIFSDKLIKEGYTINNVNDSFYDNYMMLIFNVSNDNNYIVFFIEVYDKFVYKVKLHNYNNDYDYKYLYEILSILMTSKYDSETSGEYLFNCITKN